jgi:hypothetical protein
VVLQYPTFPAEQEQVFGVCLQVPLTGQQESTVQGFPSSQFLSTYEQDTEVLSHLATTQGLLDKHLGVFLHPTPSTYESRVHASLSSQDGL